MLKLAVGGCFTNYLSLESLLALRRTCKALNQLCNKPAVWWSMLEKDFPALLCVIPRNFYQNAPINPYNIYKTSFEQRQIEQRERRRFGHSRFYQPN
ncbi:MAG: F-box protein [Proteobacteria bacterium]|nr:F-box protein [Pseudomonadota bacterium]